MAVNATLNLALDRISGRFSVDEGSTRLYVYDAAIDLSVGGWTRDEVAIGQDGKTMYEPYFQIICGGMVLAEAKLNGVENPEESEDEYFMTGTLSTNTVQMAAMFCGCAASETMRQFEARIFSTTSANPIATGRVSVWSFPSGGSNPANLPSASEALAALRTDLDAHTGNENIHVTAEEKAAWTNKQNVLTFDSAPTEDSQNPVTSGGVKAALDAEAQARAQNDAALGNAIAAEADTRHTADNELGEDIAEERNRAEGEENRIQGDLNTHKENFTIHVTATDKAAWNAKVDPTALLGYVNGGAYDSELRRILFKHDSTTVAWIDATPFILDGMVDSAYITPDGAYLVITFNTDSGKQPINIPLTDIFNPANYYDKTAADARFVQKETGKGLSTNDYTNADKAKVDNAATVAAVDSKLAGKRDKTDLAVYDGPAAWDLSVVQALYPTLTIGVAVGYYYSPTGLKYKWFISGDGSAISASEEIYDTEEEANAATQFTAQGSSDYPELAGVVVVKRATAGTDTLVKSSQLSNYASKADATLTERTGEEWQYGELTVSDGTNVWVWTYEFPQYDNGTWTTEITNGPDFITMTATGPEDATSLSFTGSGSGITASGTITRTVLRGYQLGSQHDKPLASEAEAEALRMGKQDVLTWDNSPTYNSQKPVKSGGIWSAIWGALAALPTGFTSLYDWCVSQLSGKVSTSGGTMTGALTVNYSPDTVGQSFTKLFDNKLYVGSATSNAEFKHNRITRTVGGSSVDLDFPFAAGTLALTADLPPSETWTFEVDDGQGGTTTVTKSVAVYAGVNA